MNLREIVTATIAQTKFKSNRPFQISLEFNWGNIAHFILYEAHEGSGTHHQLKYADGRWIEWEEPVAFGKTYSVNWSHGCEVYNAWVIAENIADFHERVYEAVKAMLDRYIKTINHEMDKYAKACDQIEKLK